MKAITKLSRIVRLTREQSSQEEFRALVWAIGRVIGLIETDILGGIYRECPELDDLA